MQRKIYHLGTCSTCVRILKQVQPSADTELQDIKKTEITNAQIDEMKDLAGSYEALFSRKAMKYRSMGLASQKLTEDDYRGLILSEYTFLKRPVMLIDGAIFVGNAAKTVAAGTEAMAK